MALMHLCWGLQMKTPMTLGQKKAKMIEQLLEELAVGKNSKTQYTSVKGLYTTRSACAGFRPMPTEQICVQFNELRCAVSNLSSSYYLILQGPLIVLHFPGMISCSCWTWRLLVTPVSLSCSPSDTGTKVSPKRSRPRSPCQVRHQARSDTRPLDYSAQDHLNFCEGFSLYCAELAPPMSKRVSCIHWT